MLSFRHPGGPQGQQDGFEMVVYRILFDFGVMLGPVYISCLSSNTLKFHMFFGFVSQSFFDRFLNRNFGVWDFQIIVFASMVLQKSTFHGNRF